MGASGDLALLSVRRLALMVCVAADTEIDGVIWRPHDTLACYTNIVQPCHFDDFVQAPGPGSTTGPEEQRQPRLLFSARKRPETVNIQLLLEWMNICQRDYDLSCSVEEDEDEAEPQPRSRTECVLILPPNSLHRIGIANPTFSPMP
ncbi:hypothetical protein B0T26DRAFT_713904 [Lasiosphaeria miniovina]|uniref:Uncharacterized protein n=1 Tax=Lasiosphaeria miniovina TaxID=1954250 RepID=A0AA40AMP0_9PEZI|nr:uncharacterized protein B0T26DRAFT_713904 [Lasiosphaeria miniovina]KAK0718675.1 hypothetical protein B0T26DRAFT_713904 [Lasiosphaeria miniovina]